MFHLSHLTISILLASLVGFEGQIPDGWMAIREEGLDWVLDPWGARHPLLAAVAIVEAIGAKDGPMNFGVDHVLTLPFEKQENGTDSFEFDISSDDGKILTLSSSTLSGVHTNVAYACFLLDHALDSCPLGSTIWTAWHNHIRKRGNDVQEIHLRLPGVGDLTKGEMVRFELMAEMNVYAAVLERGWSPMAHHIVSGIRLSALQEGHLHLVQEAPSAVQSLGLTMFSLQQVLGAGIPGIFLEVGSTSPLEDVDISDVLRWYDIQREHLQLDWGRGGWDFIGSGIEIALIRLTGDGGREILDSLRVLYPLLSGGGMVIVNGLAGDRVKEGRLALTKFSLEIGAADNLIPLLSGVMWQKGGPVRLEQTLVNNLSRLPPNTEYRTGIVITTHGQNFEMLRTAVESVLIHARRPLDILVFCNDADHEECHKDTLSVTNIYGQDVGLVHVQNQTESGGLTGTWNHGIGMLLENSCDVIVLINHDVEVDHSFHHLTDAASNPDHLGAYGPVSDRPGINYRGAQQASPGDWMAQGASRASPVVEHFLISEHPNFFLNGFVLAMHKQTLTVNKIDDTHFFNPLLPFRMNELEWFYRWAKKHHHSQDSAHHIVKSAFVKHIRVSSWLKMPSVMGLK